MPPRHRSHQEREARGCPLLGQPQGDQPTKGKMHFLSRKDDLRRPQSEQQDVFQQPHRARI